MNSQEQRIRERAYQIWEEEGHPQGGDGEHWQRARSEVIAGQNSEPVFRENVASQEHRTARTKKVEPKKRSSKSAKKAPEDRPRL